MGPKIPHIDSSTFSTREKMLSLVVEPNGASIRRMARQSQLRFCFGDLPDDDVLLVVTSCKNLVVLEAQSRTFDDGATSHAII